MNGSNASPLVTLVWGVFSNPVVITGAAVLGAALVFLWLVGVAWAFRDIAHRADHAWARYAAAAWVLLSGPLLLPLSLGIVALVRPQQRTGDRRLAELLDAVRARTASKPACTACGASVDPAWVRCPDCASWLARACPRCDRLAPLDAELCPWCAWMPADDGVASPARERVAALDERAAAAAQSPAELPADLEVPAAAPVPVLVPVTVPLGGAGSVAAIATASIAATFGTTAAGAVRRDRDARDARRDRAAARRHAAERDGAASSI